MTRFMLTVATIALVALTTNRLPAQETKAAVEQPAAEAKPAEPKADVKPAKPKAEAKPAEPKAKVKPAEPKAESPDLHTVEAEAFRIDLELDGAFQPQVAGQIVLRPETWTTFKVVEAVEHGRSVKRGEVLIEFDSVAFDQALADHQTALSLSALALEEAKIGLKILQATMPLSLAAAQRDRRIADEDLARFLKIDLPMSRRSAEQSLKSAEQSLQNQREELRQLEKMYAADDLTEETEEIVLTRQRHAVERAEFYFELAELRFEESIKLSLPRQQQSELNLTELTQLATDKTRATLPLELQRTRIGLEKLQVERQRDEQKLKKLLADQALMTITAPADGLVYYGGFKAGKWTGAATVAEKLKPGASAAANTPLMTIVAPRPLSIRVAVAEKDLRWFHPDLRATVHPVAYPDLILAAVVTEVDSIPAVDGKFSATFRVNLPAEAHAVAAGMTCKVKLVAYHKQRTLTVPASAVKTDDKDPRRRYVHLANAAGVTRRQPVTVGQRSGDKVEILDGLVAGDKVCSQYPEDEK